MKIKLSSRWIVPALILLFTVFVNRVVGFAAIVAYFGYLIWTSRSALLSQIAIRKYRAGDRDGALTWFAKAAAIASADGTVLLSYALVLLKAGEFDAAEEAIERAATKELSEYNANALRAMRGLLESKRGNPRKAISDLAALAGEFRNITLFGALGSLYLAEGLMEDALRFNTEAFDFDPYDSVIADNLARTRYLRGEIDEAAELLDTIIDRSPLIPEPYLNRALIHESQGDVDEAARLVDLARACYYSHLSYFSPEEIETICSRIESAATEEEDEIDDGEE